MKVRCWHCQHYDGDNRCCGLPSGEDCPTEETLP